MPHVAERARRMESQPKSGTDFAGFNGRALKGGAALNPEQVVTALTTQEANRPIDYAPYQKASYIERKEAWATNTDPYDKQLELWVTNTSSRFTEGKKFFTESKQGKDWSTFYSKIGGLSINTGEFTEETATKIHERYFDHDTKGSQIKLFVNDALAACTTNGKVDLVEFHKNQDAINWLAHIFGKQSAEVTTRLAELEAILQDEQLKKAVIQDANAQVSKDGKTASRMIIMEKAETDVLSFVHKANPETPAQQAQTTTQAPEPTPQPQQPEPVRTQTPEPAPTQSVTRIEPAASIPPTPQATVEPATPARIEPVAAPTQALTANEPVTVTPAPVTTQTEPVQAAIPVTTVEPTGGAPAPTTPATPAPETQPAQPITPAVEPVINPPSPLTLVSPIRPITPPTTNPPPQPITPITRTPIQTINPTPQPTPLRGSLVNPPTVNQPTQRPAVEIPQRPLTVVEEITQIIGRTPGNIAHYETPPTHLSDHLKKLTLPDNAKLEQFSLQARGNNEIVVKGAISKMGTSQFEAIIKILPNGLLKVESPKINWAFAHRLKKGEIEPRIKNLDQELNAYLNRSLPTGWHVYKYSINNGNIGIDFEKDQVQAQAA